MWQKVHSYYKSKDLKFSTSFDIQEHYIITRTTFNLFSLQLQLPDSRISMIKRLCSLKYMYLRNSGKLNW